MGFRLILLAGMGLAALYMVHIIAQDYNKIRKPLARLSQFLQPKSKRDIDAAAAQAITEINFTIDWRKVIRNDPLKCAQSLICQIVAGAEGQNLEAQNILALVQYSLIHDPPIDIRQSYAKGLEIIGRPRKCYRLYPVCPYSAKTMLKILEIHLALFS